MTSPAPRPQPAPAAPASGRAERTRQRILDAAGQRIAAQGYHRTTVEQIAGTAGVSKGIVYHHYRGKEAILEALLDRTLRDWGEVSSLDRLLDEGQGVLEALGTTLRESLAYARDNPLIHALFQLDSEILPILGSSAAVRGEVERSRKSLVAAMRRGIDTGELRGDDPERIADVVRLMTMALTDHLLNPEWIGVDDALIERSLDVLSNGLARSSR
jgi:TetR/AcrR family transcriptional repressor of nem operon